MNCELRTVLIAPAAGGVGAADCPCDVLEVFPTQSPPIDALREECEKRGVRR